MAWWNFPLEATVRGVRYFPTRVLMPAWATVESQSEGERRFSLERPDIRLVSTEFNPEVMRLSRSPLFPHLPVALDSLDLHSRIEREAPVDGVEIVGWMQRSAADNAIITARMEEYNRYSTFVGSAGDPYIPGLRVSDIYFARVQGYDVARAGRADLVTPRGTVAVSVGGGRTLIGSDFLAWGGVSHTDGIQYCAQALKWLRLAGTPITTSIGFPSYAGIPAPNFFTQEPDEESTRTRVTMRLSSDAPQTVHVAFRSPEDYTRVIDEADLPLRAGESEVSFIVASYPSVPVTVLHAQPGSGKKTVLMEYRAEAM